MTTAVQLIELSERHGYASRRSNGLIWRGVARAELREMNAGIDDIREGVMIWRGQGVVFHTPERICTLCNLLVRADRLDEADQLLDDADTLVVATDEAAFAADVLRVRGQIAAKRGNFDGAVESIEKAIVISQQQAARLIELRATTNLAQVLRQLGRSEEGRARLAALVKTFDTKHEIIDLVSAREVLNAC
jgi:predicted ATPase